MASVQTMMGSGLPAATAQSINVGTVATGLTAAGTTSANALALTADSNIITSAAGSTGVRLPDIEAGSSVIVVNGQASNALKVYPHTGGQLNNLAADAGGTIGVSKSGLAIRLNNTHWALIGDLA